MHDSECRVLIHLNTQNIIGMLYIKHSTKTDDKHKLGTHVQI